MFTKIWSTVPQNVRKFQPNIFVQCKKQKKSTSICTIHVIVPYTTITYLMLLIVYSKIIKYEYRLYVIALQRYNK